MEEKKLVLIDGNSIMNRAFYGVPDLTNQEGLHTNAIYGFLNILFKVLEEEKASHLLVAFDLKAPTFRHKMYEEYKGTRKPMLPELRQQMPVIKDILRAMNVLVVEQEGIEADDILGTAARMGEKEGYEVSLVSGDRDLLQLATEKIKIRIPKTRKGTTTVEDYHTQDVIDSYGVTPLQIIDLKGLMGDASDNIPGVPGIGEKTAVKILKQYPSVEEALAHVDDMPQNRATQALRENQDKALLSKELATIKTDCELHAGLDEANIEDMFNRNSYELIQNLGIKSLLKKFDQDVAEDKSIEERFLMIDKEADARAYFQQIANEKIIAVHAAFITEDEAQADHDGQMNLLAMQETPERLLGLAVTAGEEEGVRFLQVNSKLSSQLLRELLTEQIEKGCKIVTANLKDQLDFLPVTDSNQCFDVSVAAYVVNPIQNAYGEEDLAMQYAGVMMNAYSQVYGKKAISKVWEEDREGLCKYFCYSAYVAYRCYPVLHEKLQEIESMHLFEEIEMPLIFTLYDMEQRGILVKKEALKEYSLSLGQRIEELEQEIYQAAGEEFNINSPKQLGVILFEKMHMPFAKKTKTGYSTSAEVLEKLRMEDPIIDKVLEYRQLTKLKSTYADGLSVFIKEDGRIHSTFNQTITATGRISSTEPNLQNIPIRMELGRQIRKVFVPADGYIFLDADYSQIELRVLAHMAGDERLIEAYRQNADIHQSTASLVFHTPYDEVTDLQRRNAKAVNFGIVYGISGFGLSRDLGTSRKQAEQYIDDYFATYPQVKEFMDAKVEEGKEHGFVQTMFGRRRPIPEMSSGNFMQRQFGERIAMNSPIQGTAADIIKIAMIAVNEELKKRNLKSRLLLQIHDELLIETFKDEVDEVKEILQHKMEAAAELNVPLVAEVKMGNDWYEAK